MRNGTSTAPATPACDGLVIVNTEDGPEVGACIGPCCTAQKQVGAAKFRARTDVHTNGFTNAMLANLDDAEW